jgi:hypothetical protein
MAVAPVPYQFANIPNGSQIPLQKLDENFTYLTNAISGPQSVSPANLTALGPIWDATGKLSSQGDLYTGSGKIGTDGSTIPLLNLNNLGFQFSVLGVNTLLVESTGIQVQNQIQMNNNVGGILTLLPPNTGINNTFTFPATMGNDGYVLVTDGNGVTSWQAPYAAQVTSFSAGTTGLTPVSASTGDVVLGGILNPSAGGTGLSTIPLAGQLLIGTGTTYSLSTLTAGNGITITNGAGAITIALTTTVGVLSISGGVTGLTFGTGVGAVTMSGTLGIVSGGTGAGTAQTAINNLVSNVITTGFVLQGDGANAKMLALTPAAVALAGTLTNNITGSAASATTFTSTTQNSQFNSIGVGVAASGTAGVISAPTIRSAAAATAPLFQDSAGTQIGTLCRAWGNCTISGGVLILNSSFNITSVARTGVGLYTITMTTPMPNANYAIIATCSSPQFPVPLAYYTVSVNTGVTQTTNTFGLQVISVSVGLGDPSGIYFSVFA